VIEVLSALNEQPIEGSVTVMFALPETPLYVALNVPLPLARPFTRPLPATLNVVAGDAVQTALLVTSVAEEQLAPVA
jgi:hypothetical protein